MKLIEANDFNREFPEKYSWGHVDSVKFSELGSWLSAMTDHDLKTTNRNLTPGLRAALIEIAKRADI